MQHCTLSKSEFLTYLDAPLHLWAQKHDALERTLSPLQVLMMNQGYVVEEYALDFINQLLERSGQGSLLDWQHAFETDSFRVRTDALVHDQSASTFDLYEVKSGTSLKKDHIIDAAFQCVVVSAHRQLGRIFILHLNKEYIRRGDLDISQLFDVDEITKEVQEMLPQVRDAMHAALAVACADDPGGIAGCLKPKDCPCPQLCHPALPHGSIFEVPGLREKKKKELLEAGATLLAQIPPDFPLSEKQRQIVDVAVNGSPYLDRSAIASQVELFEYPLYFLDYESCISAIPLFDGYHPQQQIVFQYSLHRLDTPVSELVHTEFIDLEDRDPAALLLPKLESDIGSAGTVFVWNKSFEIPRNKEMAAIHPDYAGFVARLNDRVYDLANFIRNGWYLHPDFKGRWSLKNVLPVMVPELTYQSLQINNGSMASAAWWEGTQKDSPVLDREVVREDLSQYCALDTLAMVKILERLMKMAIV